MFYCGLKNDTLYYCGICSIVTPLFYRIFRMYSARAEYMHLNSAKYSNIELIHYTFCYCVGDKRRIHAPSRNSNIESIHYAFYYCAIYSTVVCYFSITFPTASMKQLCRKFFATKACAMPAWSSFVVY